MHCVKKTAKLIKHNCLPILMPLYIMPYIMLAYLMLLAALSSTVCLHNVYLFAIESCKSFMFTCLVLVN